MKLFFPSRLADMSSGVQPGILGYTFNLAQKKKELRKSRFEFAEGFCDYSEKQDQLRKTPKRGSELVKSNFLKGLK